MNLSRWITNLRVVNFFLSLLQLMNISSFNVAVRGVTARRQPSATESPVVHVSLPGARLGCTLSALEPGSTAGQQWLLHHHHPSDWLVL